MNRRWQEQYSARVVWLEAVVHHGERIGSTHSIVTFATATRDDSLFTEVVKKYGIPNKAYPHCTRELKANVIRSYLRSIGWEPETYKIALGIRADEPKRLENRRPDSVYPLADWWPTTKPEINDWWGDQPFRLGLLEHEGNCETCWKKSTTKLARIAKEKPGAFDWNAKMEAEYGLAGHNIDGTPRKFFRGHMSTEQLLELAKSSVPPPAQQEDFDWGCTESCEPF